MKPKSTPNFNHIEEKNKIATIKKPSAAINRITKSAIAIKYPIPSILENPIAKSQEGQYVESNTQYDDTKINSYSKLDTSEYLNPSTIKKENDQPIYEELNIKKPEPPIRTSSLNKSSTELKSRLLPPPLPIRKSSLNKKSKGIGIS